MGLIGHLIWWAVLGGFVGWIVSLVLGRDFRGGCLTYVIVGVITMVLLGWLVRFVWALIGIAVVIIAGAWLFDFFTRR